MSVEFWETPDIVNKKKQNYNLIAIKSREKTRKTVAKMI